MPTPSDIQRQRERLATNRATLAHYLKQRDIAGAANARPEVTHGIAEARSEIRRIKRTLRAWGEQAEDQGDDDEDDPDGGTGPTTTQAGGGGAAAGTGGGGSKSAKPAGKQRDIQWWAAAVGIPIGVLALLFALGQWLLPDPLRTTGLAAQAAPTASPVSKPTAPAPATPTATAPARAGERRRIYPNPEPALTYTRFVWRDPTDAPTDIAGATPLAADSGASWTRFSYSLGAEQFAGLALGFSPPLDMSPYTAIEVRVGFEKASDTCRLYLKEAGADTAGATPTPGPARDRDPGVRLSLSAASVDGVTPVGEGGGVQRVTVDLRRLFPKTGLGQVIEVGFEGIADLGEPQGHCDIYEVALRP